MTHWKWDTTTDLRNKKCKGCDKPMYLDVHHAVLYQDNNWHLHCLLDMLTEYHSGKNSTEKYEHTEWSYAP